MRRSHRLNRHTSIRHFFWLSVLFPFILLIFPHLSHSAPSENRKTSLASLSEDGDTIKILNSDENGVTLELIIPELKTEIQQFDGVRYQAISYQGCGYTSEVGNPRVPVSRLLLGAPSEAIYRVQVLDSTSNIRAGYRLPPVPRQIIKTEKDIQTITGKYDEIGSAYQPSANALYPRQLAKVIYDGYIRDQRVITLELHPVQYHPKRRMLKVYSRLVVKVTFERPSAAPNLSSLSGFSAKKRRFPSSESKVFEDFYRKKLLNYDEAKNWRKSRPPRSSVSAAPPKEGDKSLRRMPLYKIFVEKTGVYRLTYDDLNKAMDTIGSEGENSPLNQTPDLASIDPRKLSLRLRGKEIPIYVHGEMDGKFDEGDYIEFLGLKTDSIYTRWNVYWLYLSNSRKGFTDTSAKPFGKRVAEFDGTPNDPTGVLVSTFNSKINFEEDHFYQVLQHVHPEDVSPNDPHAWYEARDHWFWTGIKNSSDKNEVELKFRLYDVAPTLDRPKIDLLLTGGTPTEHEILTSINGIKMADAKWEMQDEMRITKHLRSQDELVDAKNGYNIIRCAKVDVTTEENALSYPYHIYINSFDVEYVRLLKAVNDYLEFASPESHESYEVRKRRKLEYKVSGFLNPNIEIFETNGSVLLGKVRNAAVKRVILTPEERERLRVILQDRYKEEHPTHAFAEEEEQIAAPRQNRDGPAIEDVTINIPTVAYNVTFHYPDTHDAQFIAVSEGGLLKPARLVKVGDTGTHLKDALNGADYIIITHPIYMESARRLGDWRRTSKGGNYRVKVVDVTDIYDEFNYGMVSPRAIKDFLKYAYFNWQKPAVSYVVLFGDGTFDFRGIDKKTYPEPPELSGYIPPHYVWTTYGDTSTDHWYATVSGIDVLPDFFIGRLSVESKDEAAAVVDKILKYEGSRPNGPWRRRIISVADDDTTNSGDFIFKKSLNEISQNHTLLGFETTKIFLEDIMKDVDANPAKYGGMLPGQVARKIITEELSKGAVLAQYAGHGGRVVWAHEIIFDNYAVKKLTETDKLPFLLVLSCYNGYFDKPGTPSMAEMLLRQPNAGIIGMLSATRLTYGSGNDALNRIIFDDIFKRSMRGLGEIAFNSKLELLITDGYGQFEVMQQYTLFGDPATRIAMAEYEITPEVQTPTVKPGGVLRLAPGKILRSTYDEKIGRKKYVPISDFSGKLKVTARFPGG
ncbi:MAG: C25 family cysteine peptidase, partial [Candidatus Poribacteria bacterium]